MLSEHLILCHPLLFLPSIFASIFSKGVGSLHQVYWSFSFSISPSTEYSVLISFRINWFDHLAIQGTLKSLPRHHYLKASILQLGLLMAQLSHLCLTTGKTIALAKGTFVGKVISLLFNMLSRQMSPWEQEMATHSRILTWRSPWKEVPSGLWSMGSQRIGHEWATRHRQVSAPSPRPEESLLDQRHGPALLGTGRQLEVELGKPCLLKGEIDYSHTVFWTPTQVISWKCLKEPYLETLKVPKSVNCCQVDYYAVFFFPFFMAIPCDLWNWLLDKRLSPGPRSEIPKF